MIDSNSEAILTFAEAAKFVGVNERTITRWASPTDDEGHLKRRVLESFRRGGRRYTSREAIQRFEEHSASPTPPDLSQSAAHLIAMAELKKRGFV